MGDGWRLTVRGRTTLTPNSYWWHPVIASVTAFTRDSLNLWPVVQHGTTSWQLTVDHSGRQLSHLHLKCNAEKKQMWNLFFTTYCHQPKHNICVYNIIWNKISYKITKWDIIFEKKLCYIMEVKGKFLQNLLFGASKTQIWENPSPTLFITKKGVNVTGFFWLINLPNIVIAKKSFSKNFDEFWYKNSISGVPIRIKLI